MHLIEYEIGNKHISKFGGAFYDKEKQEWWVTFSQNPELNIRLQDIEGVYQKGEIYRPG